MNAIAFKEWSIICDVLGSGRQSIIIRKGGISEGSDGFRFKYPEFFLFPTLFHEQMERTRLDPKEIAIPPATRDEITIRYFARVDWTRFVDDWETVLALEPFHVWKTEAIRERFDYDTLSGIHVAFLRIFRLHESWKFSDGPAYAGCKSWIDIPAPPQADFMEPVLSDEDHNDRSDALLSLVSAPVSK